MATKKTDVYVYAHWLELAKSVGEFFRLTEKDMNQIINEVLNAVIKWKELATKIGISRSEQELMQAAFRFI